MNPILLSFLCGAAFIGGATATTVMVLLIVQLRDKKGRKEISEYWMQSLAKHDIQLGYMARIVAVMEMQKRKDG